jgi:ABC-2 type transport system ATP-binding protein
MPDSAQALPPDPGAPCAIVARGLTKRFGDRLAIDHVNLEVPAGCAFGFLGPNGAGKTTLIRILLGLTAATEGRASLLGVPVPARRAEALARVGAIVEEPRFHLHLSGRENLEIVAAVRGRAAYRRIEASLERVGLVDRARDKVGSYSLGMRQRLGVARCLLADPQLLILDEPTNGLDPLMEGVFTDCVSEAKGEGRSVLLSSHIFAEVEKLCDTVTIIRDGRTVESGTLTELRHLQRSTITVTIDGDPAALSAVDGVYDLTADGSRVSFGVDEGALPRVMKALAPLGPRGLISTPPSLEELFLRH